MLSLQPYSSCSSIRSSIEYENPYVDLRLYPADNFSTVYLRGICRASGPRPARYGRSIWPYVTRTQFSVPFTQFDSSVIRHGPRPARSPASPLRRLSPTPDRCPSCSAAPGLKTSDYQVNTSYTGRAGAVRRLARGDSETRHHASGRAVPAPGIVPFSGSRVAVPGDRVNNVTLVAVTVAIARAFCRRRHR